MGRGFIFVGDGVKCTLPDAEWTYDKIMRSNGYTVNGLKVQKHYFILVSKEKEYFG